jgi:integrase
LSTCRNVTISLCRNAFLYTLFFTGMRPSEAVAVRIRSVDLNARTLQVERSRHLGAEAAPKTTRAHRPVRLTRSNVDVIRPLIALKAKPDDYLFVNVWGSRSTRRTSTTCSVMRSEPWRLVRCGTCIPRRTPTSRWR